MEEGGERKRKAGIELNWNTLLPSNNIDDDELPPEVVIKASTMEKPKPHWEEGESRKDYFGTKLSDNDLEAKIKCHKGMLGSMFISDGGEKLRAQLKLLEAEFDRRKLRKNDDRFKKAAPMVDGSAYIGSADGLSMRNPLVPTSLSTFASVLSRKLDDERGHVKTNAFKKEMDTINCSDQHKRVNSQFTSTTSQETSFSSRKSQFRSPRLISVNMDDTRQTNHSKRRSQSSTLSPCQFYKDASPAFVKSCAPHFLASKSCRQNDETVVILEEEELESDATHQAEKVDERIKDTHISYPSRDDPEAIEIHYSDLECLAPECYLTSTIMNFYIRYLQKPTSPTAPKRCDYHFLNTYFYKKLKQDVLNKTDRETSFRKFRRWWKGVNMFEKAYIFVPVHESLHWSLVIICIPDKEDESGPVVLHLDSLGMHNSMSVFSDVKSFLIEEWKFLRQEDVVPELPISNKVWDSLSRKIDDRVIEVPQQRNEYDCGLFVLFFMERFIDEAPERLKKKDLEKFGRKWFKPEEASSLRRKIKGLLTEEFKNVNRCIYDLDP